MARDFPGAITDYLRTSNRPISALPMTMACWAYVRNITDGHSLMALTDIPASTGYNARLTAQGNATNDPLRADLFQGGSNQHTNDANNYPANTWFHAAGVFNTGPDVIAYLDGSAGADTTTTGSPTISADMDYFALGARTNTTAVTQPLDGLIAWPCVWDVALSASEISALAAGAHPLLIQPHNVVWYDSLGRPASGGNVKPQIGAELSEVGTVGSAGSYHLGFSTHWSPASYTPRRVELSGDGFSSVAEDSLSGKNLKLTMHNARWVR